MALVALVKADTQPESRRASVHRAIDLLGGMGNFIKPGQSVLIKPNFVAAVPSAVTDFDVLRAIIEAVRNQGATPLLGECPGFEFDSAATLRFLKVSAFAREQGVEFVNFEEGAYVEVPFTHPKVRKVRVAKASLEADAIINVPRMKSHKLTTVSLAIKNCFGMIEKNSRRQIHAAGIHEGIAALYKLFHPVITIMDGLTVPAAGAVYGDKLELGAISASEDMLSLDLVCAPLLGAKAMTIEHIAIAARHGYSEPNVVGDHIEPVRVSGLEDTKRRRVYRSIYRSVYAFDHVASKLGVSTIIPWFHNKFGIHPVIKWENCNDCGECTKVCEVGAIDIKQRRIDYGKCARLRCLACIDACDKKAISTSQVYRSI